MFSLQIVSQSKVFLNAFPYNESQIKHTNTMFFFYQKHNSTIHGILELTKMSILSYHLQKLYLTEIFKETLYNNLSGHSRNPPPRKYTV